MLDFHKTLQMSQRTAPATKNDPEASKVPQLPHGISIMSKIKNDDSFTKRDFRKHSTLSKNHPWGQIHQILRLPCKMTSKTISYFGPRLPHTDELVSDVLHLSRNTKL
jgi:hypothetical protein